MPTIQTQKARPCSSPVDARELTRRLERLLLLRAGHAAESSDDAQPVQLEGTKTAVEKRLQRVSMTAGSLITTTAPSHAAESSMNKASVADAKLSKQIRVTDSAKPKNTTDRDVGSESAAKTSNGGTPKTDRAPIDANESRKRRPLSIGNEKSNESKGKDVHEIRRHGPAKEPGRQTNTANNVKRAATTRGLYAGTAPQQINPRRSSSLEAVKEEQESDSRSRPNLARAPSSSTESYLRAIQKRTNSERYSKHRRPAGAKMRTTSSDENLRGPAVGETWRAFVAAQIAKDPKSDPRRQHPSRRERDLSGRKPRPNSTADLDAWFSDIKGDQENSPPPRPKRATIDRPDWSQSDTKEKRSSLRHLNFLDPVFRRSTRRSNNMEPGAASQDKQAKRRTVCGGESLDAKKSLATVDIKVTSPTGRHGRKLSTADGTGRPPRSPPPKSPKRFSYASFPAFPAGLQVGSVPIEPPAKSPRRMHSLSTNTSSQTSRASSPVPEVAPLRTNKLDSATSLPPPSDPDPTQFSTAPKSFRANRASKLGLQPPEISAPEPVLVAREAALAALEGKAPTPKKADDTDDETDEPSATEQKPEDAQAILPDSGAATSAPCLLPPTPPPPPNANPTINVQRASIPLPEPCSPLLPQHHFLRPSTRSSTRSSRLSLRSKKSSKSVTIAPDAAVAEDASRGRSRSRSHSSRSTARSMQSRVGMRSRGREKGKAVAAAALDLESASGAADRARALARKGSGSMRAWATAGLKLENKPPSSQHGKSEKGWVRVGRGDADNKERDGGRDDGGETTPTGGLGAAAKRWSAVIWRGWRGGGEQRGSSVERDADLPFNNSNSNDNKLQIPVPRGSAKPLLPLPAEPSPFTTSSASPPSLGRVDEEDAPFPGMPCNNNANTAAALVPSPVPSTTATAFTTNTPPARGHGRLSLNFLQGFRGWGGRA
ncbi:uncharacterized protein J3D65DRAFT_6209 [Phyllosticta citribraziliensis]|uniref:Proteophosphoglycan ppg4 n=1 Tax=Phyllosticta citribraziliensis TaxID=989973 RepID=A0ABR1M9Z4_9PEZI